MDVRIQAAEAILERGMRFRLPAPLWKRWLKRDYFTILPLKAGTIVEMSRCVLLSNIESLDILLYDSKYAHKVVDVCAECIAIAILNDKKKIKTHTQHLKKKLLWEVSSQSIIELYSSIEKMNRLGDFLNITKYLLNQTAMMMNRKHLGQEESGS